MKFCSIVAASSALLTASMATANANDPTGLWLTEDGAAKVRIEPCGNAICGTLAWLRDPIDEATGKPLTDKLNADPTKRNRPMLGIPIILGMRRAGGTQWSGQIYNPDDGKTYNGSIEFASARKLKVKGCIAFLCQTETWTRSD